MEKSAAPGRGRFSVEWMAQSSCQSPDPRPGSRCERAGDRRQEAEVEHGTWDTARPLRTQGAGSTARGCRPQHPPLQTGPGGLSSETTPDPRLEEGPEGTRPRTKFSTWQLKELEKSFQQQRYIGVNEKRRLARVLQLSELRIKTWFQNRRMKFKRQSQDARVEAFFSGLLHPYAGYPEAQAPEVLPRMVPVSLPSLPPSVSNNTPGLTPYGLPGLPPVPYTAMGPHHYPAHLPPLPWPEEYPRHRYHPYYPSGVE